MLKIEMSLVEREVDKCGFIVVSSRSLTSQLPRSRPQQQQRIVFTMQ